MDTDFSCDYLVDITGLVDDGKNLYSCCHPSGVMCGKEDCPVVIDFHKRSQKDTVSSDYENPSGTIDYDSLTRGKLCPLKATRPPVLGFWNLDPAPDLAATGEPPRVEYIGGRCDGPRCAWYDQTAERCAVLSLARNK